MRKPGGGGNTTTAVMTWWKVGQQQNVQSSGELRPLEKSLSMKARVRSGIVKIRKRIVSIPRVSKIRTARGNLCLGLYRDPAQG